MGAIEANPYFVAGSERSIDPDDPDAPATDRYFLLDRPRIEARPGLTRTEIPVVEGEVIVGSDVVVLETYDDSRLDRLVDRFTAAARGDDPAGAPAHQGDRAGRPGTCWP